LKPRFSAGLSALSLAWLAPTLTEAQIAFDSASSAATSGPQTNLSCSHATGGCSRLLVLTLRLQ